MDNNLIIFREGLKQSKFDLVIIDYKVVLLLGLEENDPQDYYWIYTEFHDESKKNINPKYMTCIEGMYPLKGMIPDKQYDGMVDVWNMNHQYFLCNINKIKEKNE